MFSITANKERKHIVVIGNGNVTLDCAHNLVKSIDNNKNENDLIQTTDLADWAITALFQGWQQPVDITILGWGGHV